MTIGSGAGASLIDATGPAHRRRLSAWATVALVHCLHYRPHVSVQKSPCFVGNVRWQPESGLGHCTGNRCDGVAVAPDGNGISDRVLEADRLQRADLCLRDHGSRKATMEKTGWKPARDLTHRRKNSRCVLVDANVIDPVGAVRKLLNFQLCFRLSSYFRFAVLWFKDSSFNRNHRQLTHRPVNVLLDLYSQAFLKQVVNRL